MSRRTYTLGVPDGYEELECINTTGSAAFAVTYNSVPATRGFSVTFKNSQSPTSAFIFCGCARSTYMAWALRLTTSGGIEYMYIPSGDTAYAYKNTNYTSGNYATVSYINGELFYCNGTSETAPSMKTNNTTGSKFAIGGYYGTRLVTNNRKVIVSFKRVQLYDDTMVVIDLIPARQLSDNKIGMYDIINHVFYSSTTGTEFTTN